MRSASSAGWRPGGRRPGRRSARRTRRPVSGTGRGCLLGAGRLASHSENLGVDANRVLIVGVSAGGGIAAATALMARDRRGPALTHQVLITPMLDDRSITPSSRFEDVTHPRASNEFGWRAILGDRSGGLDVSPYAAPARAADSAHCAVLPGGWLADTSGTRYRLRRSSGCRWRPLELHVWAGGMHGFDLQRRMRTSPGRDGDPPHLHPACTTGNPRPRG